MKTSRFSIRRVNRFDAGTVFRRQILTSEDDPRTKRIIQNNKGPTHNIGIQMKRKELTKTFVMVSNWKKLCKKILQSIKSWVSTLGDNTVCSVGSLSGYSVWNGQRSWPTVSHYITDTYRYKWAHPVNTGRADYVVSMLSQRLRRWHSIETT